MKFTLIAFVTFLGVALATSGGSIPNGSPCKKDGSMGICKSGFCLQASDKSQGQCADGGK